MKSAWADIERFKEQKNHDLKEALISYAVMQISMCKKVRVAWERLAQCICPVSSGEMQPVSNWEHGSHGRLAVTSVKPPTYSILLELSDMLMLRYI